MELFEELNPRDIFEKIPMPAAIISDNGKLVSYNILFETLFKDDNLNVGDKLNSLLDWDGELKSGVQLYQNRSLIGNAQISELDSKNRLIIISLFKENLALSGYDEFLKSLDENKDVLFADDVFELFNQTLKMGQIGIWEVDIETQDFRYTQSIREIYKVPAEIEITRELLQSFYLPETKAMVKKAVDEAFDTGKKWDIVVGSHDYHRNLLWIRGIGGVTVGRNGRKKLVGYVQDLTEKRNTEDAYSHLFFYSPLPKLIYSLHGKGILEVNQEALNFFECQAPRELLGKNLMEISARKQKGTRTKELARQLKAESDSDSVFETEWQFLTAKGKVKDANVSLKRINLLGQERILVTFSDISNRLSEHRQIRRLKENYQRAQEIASVGSWTKNLSTGEEEFSPVGLHLLGLEVVGDPRFQDFLDIIDEVNRNAIEQGLIELEREKRDFSYLLKLSANGEAPYTFVLDMTFTLRGSDVDVNLLGTFHDVTLRENAIAKVKESADFTEAINNATPNILYVFDLQKFSNVYTNKHIEEILGYSKDEVQSMGASFLPTIVHKEDKHLLDEHFSKVFIAKDQEVLSVEYRVKHKNGDYIWLISRDVVFKRNQDGKPRQTLGVAYDISARKESEFQIKDQNFKIQSILQSSKTRICSVNLDRQIVFHNRLFVEFINTINGDKSTKKQLETTDWESKELAEIFRSEDISAKFYEGIDRSRVVGEVAFQEKVIDSKGELTYQIKINPIYNREEGGNGALEGHSIFITDITELVLNQKALIKATEQAEAANKAKSVFLANMSHEIRTPLNAILGFAELMKNEAIKPEVKNYAQTIVGSGKALLNIINDILDLSKIEAGKIELRYEDVSLRQVADEVVTLYQYRAEKKGLKLIFDDRIEKSYDYYLDGQKVAQILNNLVSNAIKFTDEGEIYIVAEMLEHESLGEETYCDLILSVADKGIGIPESQQQRIFQPFIQQDEQDSRKYGGTGLGLSIIKNLSEMMNGELSLESEHGKGSTFRVHFHNVRYRKRKDEAQEKVELEAYGALILSVDDSDMNQKIIQGILKKTPHHIHYAMNAHQAMDFLENNNPDLIIMDIHMPEVDGVELTKNIRSQEQFSDIAIIAATGYVFDEDDKSKELFSDIIYKPINSKALLNAVDKYVTSKTKVINTNTDSNVTKTESHSPAIVKAEVTEAEWKRFGPQVNKLAFTMEMDAIDNLAKEMADYYSGLPQDKAKQKERVAYFVEESNILINAISEFDIDMITVTLNKLKEKFNTYNEN